MKIEVRESAIGLECAAGGLLSLEGLPCLMLV